MGNIVDAMGRNGAMDAAIKPVTRAQGFIGSALTVEAGPRDNLAPWAALRFAQPGDVLVISTGGFTGSSVCGDILVGMAKNAGVVAIVTDGVVRDRAGCDAAGIPVFARGLSPNSPQKNGPGAVGLPIVCAGVACGQGDIVVGDEDGVVVIPAARAGEVGAALEEVRAKEADMEAALARGDTMPSWVADPSEDELFEFLPETRS
ncbi:MAG: hypothetical protein H0X68_08215 [Chloroflexi bacterium]|nr:hypothetical protein [Chloroflexota bacterium]